MRQLTDEERGKRLVETLRSGNCSTLICDMAAQEIERLSTEVRKLREELDFVRRDEERFIYD